MSHRSALRTADVLDTRAAFTRGTPDRADRLRACALRPIRAARTLREWHDLLLFVAAHPSDEATYAFAHAELRRMRDLAARVASHARLNTGISGGAVEANFSRPLVRWLLRRWPEAVSLASVDADAETVREVLRTLLLPVEIEAADLLDGGGDAMLAAVFGDARGVQLTHLMARLDALAASDAVRDGLFARLSVYLRIDGAAECALTTARAPTGPPCCHAGALRRGADLPEIVAEPLGAPVSLTPSARHALLDTARTVLTAMQRETDPVTHASDVTLHDMGRGLRIALFSLDLAHRLPFDSYVGFMAFRNGVPLAYGGAWVFPLRSKIGINVLPSQRGGESAWFFAQLLRLYHHRFGVTRFEAENYQLGHGNPDGLKSGAYWFYYRAGFRPTTPALGRMAAREADRLSATRSYAVPLPRLRALVAEGLELQPDAASGERALEAPIDTAALTRLVQQHVVRAYGGDRARAQSSALRRVQEALGIRDDADLPACERAAYRLWALPLDLVPNLHAWPAAERRRLDAIVRAKGAPNERRHQQLLSRLPRLLEAWRTALSAEATRASAT